ncbi:unnamed protein product [Urochloa humidicola]
MHDQNLDRQIVLVHDDKGKQTVEDEEEEAYVFEEDDEVVQMQTKWLAIARYYSSKDYKLYPMFKELSNLWGWERENPMPARELEDHVFLVEFDSEKLWRRVLNGGPWKYREDAVIFVAYDGVQRVSEISIESLPMWVRIYDIPVKRATTGFARVLGAKIGKVLEVGELRKNYKRVRMDFPLEKPLMKTVEQVVKDEGLMVFRLRYENVPFFCFGCGRIGHAKEECPDEDDTGDSNFAKGLRCSPQKWDVGR